MWLLRGSVAVVVAQFLHGKAVLHLAWSAFHRAADVTGDRTGSDRSSARGRTAVLQNVSATDMTAPFNFDAEPLQQLLCDAFAVQESGMNKESLAAIVKVQGLIATGELDIDRAMGMIAAHAQNVANAAGIAIGLLNGDQLVYRAGSGSAAPRIGQQVIATLCVSSRNAASREILRVENAQTDKRIESSICRQFGAQSLLILPIHHDGRVAGVLEVLFAEAHTFQQREVRTYRLMAGLVEEAMSCATRPEQKTSQAADLSALRQHFEQIRPQVNTTLSDAGPVLHVATNGAPRKTFGDSYAAAVKAPALEQSALAESKRERSKRAREAPPYQNRWKSALAVAAVLVLACGVAYRDHRRTLSPSGAAALPRSNPIEQQALVVSTQGQDFITSKPHTALGPTEDGRRTARTKMGWVRVGDNELDYVTKDVTVRYFTPNTAQSSALDRNNQVRHISDDVTVRHFTPQPPVARTTQPAGH